MMTEHMYCCESSAEGCKCDCASNETAKRINKRQGDLMMKVIAGHDDVARYRTPDGFIRWGIVQKDMQEIVFRELAETR